MRKKLNITYITILLLFQAILFISCRTKPIDEFLGLKNAFSIKIGPELVKTSVAYGNLTNEISSDLILEKIDCTGYDAVEWHETKVNEKGIMKMQKIAFPIKLPALGKQDFVPGGNHLMLIGRHRKILEGEKLKLTFTFSDERKMEIMAGVTK